jgi:hypothetical protein
MDQEIVPFLIDVPEAELTDLRRRLRQTRWPEPELVPDWSKACRSRTYATFAATGPTAMTGGRPRRG